MQSSRDESKYVLVALNMSKLSDDFEAFEALSAKEKIQLVEDHIHAICIELQTKEPDAMWIVSWQEYGITEKGAAKGLPREVKTLLKEKMQALTEQYPQLTIIAGTVSTKTHVQDEAKLKRINTYYENHPWVEEKEIRELKRKRVEIEKNRVKTALASYATHPQGFDVLRNTSFVFNGKSIWRHDKMTPVDEQTYQDRKALFQTGNKKNPRNDSCVTIAHPITGEAVTLGVEICNEHTLAVLKETAAQKPYFHFVMSDSVGLKLDNLYGDYALQLDSRYKPRVILSHPDHAESAPVHLYQNNIDQPPSLIGPLQPIYPFVYQVRDKLDEMISAVPEKSLVLQEIREKFLAAVNAHDKDYDSVEVVYKVLDDGLQDERLHDVAAAAFFQPTVLNEKIKELHSLIELSKTLNSRGMDYRTSLDAPLAAERSTLAHKTK